MKYLFILVGAAIIVGLTIFLRVRYYTSISKDIISSTTRFSNESTDTSKSLLVLGDSTAYGVGATDSRDSLPALISSYVGATYTENHGVSGSRIEDLPLQVQAIKKERYDLIVVQIGANNIVARDEAEESSKKLEPILIELKKRSGKLILLTAGNVGGAPAIPFIFRKYFTNLTIDYHEKFQKLADKEGIIYVNLYDDPSSDPFVINPKTNFAKDKFHPSSEGYKIWFSKLKKYL